MKTAGVVPPVEVVDTSLDHVYCTHCARLRSQTIKERTRNVENEHGQSELEYYYIFCCDYCGYEFDIPDGFDFDITFTLTSRGMRFGQLAKFMSVAEELGVEANAGVVIQGDYNQLTIQIPSGRVLQALDLKSQVTELQAVAKEVSVNA